MFLIQIPIKIDDIRRDHSDFFEGMVKIVIDVNKEIIAVNAEMHADLEDFLLENESRQSDLWGANVYFKAPHNLEFTSLINIRPGQDNRSMEVQNPILREKMSSIVKKLIFI